jgi:hypothetical protein
LQTAVCDHAENRSAGTPPDEKKLTGCPKRVLLSEKLACCNSGDPEVRMPRIVLLLVTKARCDYYVGTTKKFVS